MSMSLLLIFLQLFLAIIVAASQALPGCENLCGNISVPYPFGTRPGCFKSDDFLVTCNSSFNPPKLYLTTSLIEVTDIFLSGELRIQSWIARDCYNKQHLRVVKNNPWMRFRKFPVSHTRNKFIAVGCDSYAVIKGSQGRKYTTGCLSLCDSIDNVINGSCSGIGCCQTIIPKEVRSYNIRVNSYDNHSSVWDFNPCSYSFVAEDNTYTFSSLDLADLQGRTSVPVVLDWAVGNETCVAARKNQTSFACKQNSKCYNFDNGPGYRCNCSDGYEGNPYLSNGCQDIDECKISSPCNMTCHNLPGRYVCSCPEGYQGDGKKSGSGCSRIPRKSLPLINIALGISISISVLLLGGSWLYWGFRQRKIIKLREKFFEQNGGIMLLQKLPKRDESVQSSKRTGSAKSFEIYTEECLKKATNNYHESRILGQGGQGTVYKGILPDDTTVAIKKSKIGNKSQVEQFVNEIIILSQINHTNVVKLLGCCLETQVPLLVYEFVINGTLYDHIHTKSRSTSSITWENRLRIATETAGVLSYLHSDANPPIIHRDIKSNNILLDENYTAKVSDFGASRLFPTDQTQLTTLVQGTLGYLDPEYFQTSQLTEKSDVYSFGVLLVELLTGKEALSYDRPEKERNIAMYFVSSLKEDRLLEIVDQQVIREGKAEKLEEFSIVAKRCLEVKGDERPTMKEVAMELQGLRTVEKHPWVVNDSNNAEESQSLLGEPSNAYGGDENTRISASYDSMVNHVISPFDDGR
ncbi:putative wall-associated receptor kinase-like 16 [Actinidia eriantha]|uniref:putative wall-associated receptor kinase-like 16 n=1 Tax=Actinidia eriantha TaxID=165200 RepID=UPI0025878879|nr:putative wall-associated receptor kinase-like 16 [Actinidia eriantha]